MCKWCTVLSQTPLSWHVFGGTLNLVQSIHWLVAMAKHGKHGTCTVTVAWCGLNLHVCQIICIKINGVHAVRLSSHTQATEFDGVHDNLWLLLPLYRPILASISGYRYTSSPVVCLPVSTVNTVAMHAYSFKPIPYFRAYTPHTCITCTHLYPAQNRIFSTKNLYSPVSVLV